MSLRKSALVLLFCLTASTILFLNLNRVPLFEPDEGRYADIALTMVKTGDWIIPRMNYVTHLHKPPFSSWLVAASFKILGPSEFSARLPNILLSLAVLLGMIGLGRFLFDFDTGLLSAWILLTSVLYLAISRIVTPDMALTFWTFVAMSSAAFLFFGVRCRLFFLYVGAVALGMGMLTKGPVVWMIGLLPTILFAVWKKRGGGISWKQWALAGMLMLAISFSWYVLIALRNPGALPYFIQYQLLDRVFKGTTGHRHPLYYYLIVLPLGFLPWTLFMPTAFAWSLRKGSHSDEERDRIHFLFLWFVIPLILFSLVRTKLATYVVPLFPPLALLAGRFWKEFDAKAARMTRPLLVSCWGLCWGYVGIMIACLIFIRIKPEVIAGIPLIALFLGGVILFLAWSVMTWTLLKRKFERFFPLQVGILVIAAMATFAALPLIQYKNAKVFADKILELRRPGDVTLMYDRYFATLPFYLNERVVTVGIPSETAFESDPLLKTYSFPGKEKIKEFVEGSERIFVLTDEEGYARARHFTQAPLYPVLKQQGLVLFSNRPQ